MKKHFDSIKKKMEADSGKDHKAFYNTYWLGFIHGMNEAGYISGEERDKLIDYGDSLFCPRTEVS